MFWLGRFQILEFEILDHCLDDPPKCNPDWNTPPWRMNKCRKGKIVPWLEQKIPEACSRNDHNKSRCLGDTWHKGQFGFDWRCLGVGTKSHPGGLFGQWFPEWRLLEWGQSGRKLCGWVPMSWPCIPRRLFLPIWISRIRNWLGVGKGHVRPFLFLCFSVPGPNENSWLSALFPTLLGKEQKKSQEQKTCHASHLYYYTLTYTNIYFCKKRKKEKQQHFFHGKCEREITPTKFSWMFGLVRFRIKAIWKWLGIIQLLHSSTKPSHRETDHGHQIHHGRNPSQSFFLGIGGGNISNTFLI